MQGVGRSFRMHRECCTYGLPGADLECKAGIDKSRKE